MTEPVLRDVQCLDSRGLHRMAYWQWGDAANPKVLVCVHGLTRQGRDFDTLARAMAGEYRVVCPDVVGRGRSDWLADPMGYAIPGYVADMVCLLARLDAQAVDWVGTSMGGLIGLGLASLSGSPVRKLVLNDVGPVIEPAALQRIGSYVGQQQLLGHAGRGGRRVVGAVAGLRPAQPRAVAGADRAAAQAGHAGRRARLHRALRPGHRRAVPRRDARAGRRPARRCCGRATTGCSARRCCCAVPTPTCCRTTTAQAMTQRGPRAQLHQFAGVGHAPTLVHADQIEVLRRVPAVAMKTLAGGAAHAATMPQASPIVRLADRRRRCRRAARAPAPLPSRCWPARCSTPARTRWPMPTAWPPSCKASARRRRCAPRPTWCMPATTCSGPKRW